MHEQYPVRVLCDALNVDRGTFYNHLLRNKKQDTWYVHRKEELSVLVQKLYDESHQIYGANKIHAILQERDVAISQKYVPTIMKELGLSIAKTSVEMMLGQIKTYNDQGAVFKITLALI